MKLFFKNSYILIVFTFIFILFPLAPINYGDNLQMLAKNIAFQTLQENTNGPFVLEIPTGRITYYFNFPVGRLISNSFIKQAIEKRDKQIRESRTYRYLNWLANEGFINFNFPPKPNIAKKAYKKDDEYYMEIVYDFEISLTDKSKKFLLHEQEKVEGNYRRLYLKLSEINITRILDIKEGKSLYTEGLMVVTYEWKYSFTPIAEGLFHLHFGVITGRGLFSVIDFKNLTKVEFFELDKEIQIRKAGFSHDGDKWRIVMYIDRK